MVLTFGATDPVGTLGIQADLACFAAMGCHGVSVVTSILIADTARVEDMQVIDADWVADQARVLLEDMTISAFKVGAVGSTDNVAAIAEIMADYPDVPLILDPFLSALPDPDQEWEPVLMAMRELLVPQATLFMASSVELARFAESWRDTGGTDMLGADVAHLTGSGCEYVLVTGTRVDGHELANTLFDSAGKVRQDAWRRLPGSFSGAGSTISGTVAALLANGMDVPEAVVEAQEFTHAALVNAHRLGMGRLTPDRYFWARDENDAPADTSSPPIDA